MFVGDFSEFKDRSVIEHDVGLDIGIGSVIFVLDLESYGLS